MKINCLKIGLWSILLSTFLFAQSQHVTPNKHVTSDHFRDSFSGAISYSRKSISSVDSLLFSRSEEVGVGPLEAKELFDASMHMKRFDFNPLPPHISDQFIKAVQSTSNITADSLTALIDEYIVSEINKVLSDPRVQKERINAFKSEQKYTFDALKGKSFSVTSSDLERLYNSSFFYFPHITQAQSDYDIVYRKDKDKDKLVKKLNVDVSFVGHVYWYRIQFLSNGEAKIDFIDAFSEKRSESDDFHPGRNPQSAIAEVLRSEISSWSQSAALQTQKLDYFNLVGTVETHEGREYSLGLFDQEGVQLGHYYWLMEDVEESSVLSSQPVGVSFIRGVGSRENESERFSKAYQVYGDTDHFVSWVKEAPKMGVDMTGGFSYKSGFLIDARDGDVAGLQVFNNNVTSSFGLAGLLSVHLGQFGLSQYFIDFDGSFNFTGPGVNYGGIPYLFDTHIGVRKSLWFRDVAVQPYFRMGMHYFYIDSGDQLEYFKMDQFVLRCGVSVEKMVFPFWLLQGNVYGSIGISNPVVEYKTYDVEGSFESSHSKLNWIGVSLGLKYLM